MPVEVFQTNINDLGQAEELRKLLLQHFPGSRINFDLQDCDRILRVEASAVYPDKIIAVLRSQQAHCRVLE
ncbi:MAG TPA: hypothetical protein VF145_09765 [Chitinophagaceae bacterium]